LYPIIPLLSMANISSQLQKHTPFISQSKDALRLMYFGSILSEKENFNGYLFSLFD